MYRITRTAWIEVLAILAIIMLLYVSEYVVAPPQQNLNTHIVLVPVSSSKDTIPKTMCNALKLEFNLQRQHQYYWPVSLAIMYSSLEWKV